MIKQITGKGAHYAVETTGISAIVLQAVHAVKPLGTVAIVGFTGDITLNVQNDLMAEGKSLVGVIEGDAVPALFIPLLVQLYKQGKFPIDKLIARYPLADINQAFADSASGKVIKRWWSCEITSPPVGGDSCALWDLFQRHVMLHHPAKQRQSGAHKAVLHFKPGALMQANAQQAIPPAQARRPAHRAGKRLLAAGEAGKLRPVVSDLSGEGQIRFAGVLPHRVGHRRLSNT
ncbi:benzyl alcohol dehydrogenase [Klebsiella pneumoniae subsp. pneumoniae]|uniref:Benzyl alcohol dehydrogenase n=1 Tax=Klebsiella pneumoniae subsp. pneumoniae TaxID=72407 RepID=A0A377ZJA3_KLEPN|nr:benzyl alcohol dehydrogenase [Klebsiella pneumoniae subsp. pneumoniae]